MAKFRFRSLDGLRGVCALTVVLYHCELLFKPGVIFCHGYLAVDMFFLLSGFVIAASYDTRLEASLNAGQFLMLRIRRLAPVYWAGLALCLAGALLAAQWLSAPSVGQVMQSALMAAVLVPHLGPGSFAYPVNPVAWTLAWELVVNVCYALWLRRLASRPLQTLIALLLMAAIAESLVNPRGWSFGMTGLDIGLAGLRAFPEFLMGVVLFRLFLSGKLNRLPRLTPLVPIAAWAAIASIPETSASVDAFVVIFVCPLLVALLVRNDAESPGWFAPLGAISYPLYASHWAVLALARETPVFGLYHHADPLRAGLVVLLACAVAWGVHRLIERKPEISGFSQLSGSEKALSSACLGSPDRL